MSTETLTSLAMLKVHVDRRQDYLDYLRPFILQVLVAHTPDPVTDAIVRDLIRADFGLEIPDRAVQVVIKRLSRQYRPDGGNLKVSYGPGGPTALGFETVKDLYDRADKLSN